MDLYKQEQKNRKLLLTSVCRPLGPRYGDGESVGYELLYGQVTRAQGIFSRSGHSQGERFILSTKWGM